MCWRSVPGVAGVATYNPAKVDCRHVLPAVARVGAGQVVTRDR